MIVESAAIRELVPQSWVTVLRMITAGQCRGARGILGWNQADLAKAAGLAVLTVQQFEAGIGRPRRSTIAVIRQAFESAGVEFIDENGGGARGEAPQVRSSEGKRVVNSARPVDFRMLSG